MGILELRPNAWLLAGGVALDLLFGDPYYPAHPVRLIGWTLTRIETILRKVGLSGYLGGVILFLLLALFWAGGLPWLVALAPKPVALALNLFLIYSLLALCDLLRHGWHVESAARRGDLDAARAAISKLVGRDTSRMDLAACRRAAIESLSENLTDGFISPIFWYAVAGLPGLVLFKVVSTMDSMVGYKTPRYLRFGWCGARTDDLMNWLPARLTWLLMSLLAFLLPRYSGAKTLAVGWRQHAVVPGPNSGWSEAAIAGALCRKLIGPIWAQDGLVTDVWLGDPADPPAGESPSDFKRAAILVAVTGLCFAALTCTLLGWNAPVVWAAEAPPKRIVSTLPSVTETLFALGAGGHVVGVSDFCRYPPAALALPKIGSFTDADPERIVRLHPDLVILQDWMTALGDRLSSLQVRSLKVKVGSLADIHTMITVIGNAIGSSAQATQLNSSLDAQLHQLSGRKGPAVLMIIGRNPGTLTNLIAVGPAAYLGEVLQIAGGRNIIASKAVDYPHISLETVIRLNPDVIFDMSRMGQSARESELRQDWLSRKELRAVQTGKVFGMLDTALVTPGPRVVEAARLLQAKLSK